MQGVATLIPSIIPDSMNEILRILRKKLAVVLELLHVLFVFGLLVDLLLGLSVPSEEHCLQALEPFFSQISICCAFGHMSVSWQEGEARNSKNYTKACLPSTNSLILATS